MAVVKEKPVRESKVRSENLSPAMAERNFLSKVLENEAFAAAWKAAFPGLTFVAGVLSLGTFAAFCPHPVLSFYVGLVVAVVIQFWLVKTLAAFALKKLASAPPNPQWSGWSGKFVMIAGVALPALALFLGLAVFVFADGLSVAVQEPFSAARLGVLLLLLPVVNYLAWATVCKYRGTDQPVPLAGTIMLGVSAGATLPILALMLVFSCPLVTENPVNSVFLFPLLVAVCAVRIVVARALRNSTSVSCMSTIRNWSYIGLALSVVTMTGPEIRSCLIDIGEQMAEPQGNDDAQIETRRHGLELLRLIQAEDALLHDCYCLPHNTTVYHRRPLSAEVSQKLYFNVTGHPYTSVPRPPAAGLDPRQADAFLGGAVVGQKIGGLAATDSHLACHLSPQTLSSKISWDLTLRNNTLHQQEARAQIALPPGAVVSHLSLRSGNQETNAFVGPRELVANAYRRPTQIYRDPVLITTSGTDSIMLQCFPVPPFNEMKVKVEIASPLELNNSQTTSLTPPRFIETNFDLPVHQYDFTSESRMSSKGALLAGHSTNHLQGQISSEQLNDEGLVIQTLYDAQNKAAVLDTQNGSYAVHSVRSQQAPAPNHSLKRLVVVIDGSASMGRFGAQIADALDCAPQQTTILFASNEASPLDLSGRQPEAGIQKTALRQARYVGGQENFPALLQAAQLAAQHAHSAVLWVHGPQFTGIEPEDWQNILTLQPTIYDLQVSTGNNFLRDKISSEQFYVFHPVARRLSPGEDLKQFLLSCTGTTRNALSVHRERVAQIPGGFNHATDRSADSAVKLLVAKETSELIKQGKRAEPEQLAGKYNLVTQVTGAIAMATKEDYVNAGLVQRPPNNAPRSGSMPSRTALRANTAAAIVPQITIPAQNTQAIETLLNILCNSTEIVGLFWGLPFFVTGIIHAMRRQRDASLRMVIGAAAAVIGLATPGMVNYVVYMLTPHNYHGFS